MSLKPDDLVELGKIQDAYGLKGWVTVLPETADPQVLLRSKRWWISRIVDQSGVGAAAKVVASKSLKGSRAQPANLVYVEVDVLASKIHGSKLVAHFMGFEDRTRAESLKGSRVFVSRSRFPSPEEGEFYWVDLIGCEVVNLQGVKLGQVSQVVDHGAHAILEVGQHLIPFVQAYVPAVSLQDRLITVDWQEDYT